MKKYKLTKVTKEYSSTTLYQIEALKSFGNVTKGDKGGYVEKEYNLSQEGESWVFGDAEVFGDAKVFGDAWVSGKLKLKGGHFYHYKKKTERIETVEVDDDYELLASEPKLADVEKAEDLSGEEVTVTIKGKSYTAVIK